MNVFAPNDWPWPAKRHQTVDGALHYIDVGAGPAVCFVHGTPTSSYEWRHQIRALQDTHRCIALDHLGFGQSERPAHASYTPEAHAVRFRAFMDTRADRTVHARRARFWWTDRARLGAGPSVMSRAARGREHLDVEFRTRRCHVEAGPPGQLVAGPSVVPASQRVTAHPDAGRLWPSRPARSRRARILPVAVPRR